VIDDEQTSIFDPVADIPHARTTDAWTSHNAGRAIEKTEGATTTLRPRTAKHLALAALADHPDTALGVERTTRKRGIWKRVSDLKNADLLQEIGTRVDPVTGRPGIIWTVNPRGRRVLELLEEGEVVQLNG
jgi:hypothetical protein